MWKESAKEPAKFTKMSFMGEGLEKPETDKQ